MIWWSVLPFGYFYILNPGSLRWCLWLHWFRGGVWSLCDRADDLQAPSCLLRYPRVRPPCPSCPHDLHVQCSCTSARHLQVPLCKLGRNMCQPCSSHTSHAGTCNGSPGSSGMAPRSHTAGRSGSRRCIQQGAALGPSSPRELGWSQLCLRPCKC